MDSDSERVADGDIFYFESDHLALRGNRDYTNMLRTIAVLEAQKIRVQKHIEELALAKKRFLEDPELFLQKIKNNEEIISPNYMTIATIPEIGHYEDMPEEEVEIKEKDCVSANDDKSNVQMYRGRVMDDSKPETFNQLWTVEEQKRLEELLIKYPEERIEMHRFSKIAKELGNRTARQVSSRVQKYFQKLRSAGLPIPGRIPKNRRAGHTKSKHYYRPSTFFPSYNVPVYMPDDDVLQDLHSPAPPDNASTVKKRSDSTDSTDSFSDLNVESMTKEVQQQMLHILKMIREEKICTPEGYNPDPMAAKCGTCQDATVSRLGWRCNTCCYSLNLCGDCLVDQLVHMKFDHFSHDVVAENEL